VLQKWGRGWYERRQVTIKRHLMNMSARRIQHCYRNWRAYLIRQDLMTASTSARLHHVSRAPAHCVSVWRYAVAPNRKPWPRSSLSGSRTSAALTCCIAGGVARADVRAHGGVRWRLCSQGSHVHDDAEPHHSSPQRRHGAAEGVQGLEGPSRSQATAEDKPRHLSRGARCVVALCRAAS
jgi:hypothetical protein